MKRLILLTNSVAKSALEAFLWYRYKLNLSTTRVSNQGVDFLLKKEYHSIEKGLSLRNSRPIFGKEPRENTKELIKRTQSRELAGFASEALEEYENRRLKDNLRKGGSFYVSKDDIFGHSTPKEFIASRRSVRQYEPGSVSEQEVADLMRLSIEAPSVCNRQHWRVVIIRDKSLIDKVLTYQNGNRGFTQEIFNLAVICTDRAAFSDLERAQMDFDSGLFTQQFLLSLHAMHLAACPLNAAMSPKRTFGVHRALGLSHRFKIGAFVSFGYPSEKFHVAHSSRPDVGTFYDLY
jgi:nitroreductase